jgi:hypothetical protein
MEWVITHHPVTQEDRNMITDFDDFCIWVYVIVDDIWEEMAPLFKRPGPKPICSNSELITMALVGEYRGLDKETEMLSY